MVLEIGYCPSDSPAHGGSLLGHRATGRHPASNSHTPGKRKPLFMKGSLGEKDATIGYCCHRSTEAGPLRPIMGRLKPSIFP